MIICLKDSGSKTKKVDTVELPPKMKAEAKADVRAATSNGTAGKVVIINVP